MDEIKQDVKLIRESQIRMEENVKYHIKRTDILEEQVEEIKEEIKPLYVIHFFKNNFRFLMFIIIKQKLHLFTS